MCFSLWMKNLYIILKILITNESINNLKMFELIENKYLLAFQNSLYFIQNLQDSMRLKVISLFPCYICLAILRLQKLSRELKRIFLLHWQVQVKRLMFFTKFKVQPTIKVSSAKFLLASKLRSIPFLLKLAKYRSFILISFTGIFKDFDYNCRTLFKEHLPLQRPLLMVALKILYSWSCS